MRVDNDATMEEKRERLQKSDVSCVLQDLAFHNQGVIDTLSDDW